MPVAEIAWLFITDHCERLPASLLLQLRPRLVRVEPVEDFLLEILDIEIVVMRFLFFGGEKVV